MKFKTGDIVRSIHTGITYMINSYLKDKKAYECTLLDGSANDPPIGTIRWLPGRDIQAYNVDLYISYFDNDDYLYIDAKRNRK